MKYEPRAELRHETWPGTVLVAIMMSDTEGSEGPRRETAGR